MRILEYYFLKTEGGGLERGRAGWERERGGGERERERRVRDGTREKDAVGRGRWGRDKRNEGEGWGQG
jgi:hypothetical protein